MKNMKFYCLGILVNLLFFSAAVYAKNEAQLTRAGFVKLLVSEKFSQEEISACDKTKMPFVDVRPRSPDAPFVCLAFENGIINASRKFRPAARLILAEAAFMLTKAFDLEIPEYEPSPEMFYVLEKGRPWHLPYLTALEEQNAIPISFWTPGDFATRAEAVEMITRLKDGITAEPSMTFEALHFQRIHDRAVNFLRFGGDSNEPLTGSSTTQGIMRLFQEPATYYITDVDYAEQDDRNFCHNFYTQHGQHGNITVVKDGDNATVEIEAVSGDYCVFPFPEMEEGTCPADAQYADDPRCNVAKTRNYSVTLEKKGDKLFAKDSENNRLRIERAPIGRICREFAPDCPAGFYDYAKVETAGTLSKITTNGKTWNIYTTVWKPIFGDLRGVPFLQFEKKLGDGKLFKKIYEAPNHNRDSWQAGMVSYEKCFADPAASSLVRTRSLDFCIKREGNNFVIASPHELGDHMSIWIDTNYRR